MPSIYGEYSKYTRLRIDYTVSQNVSNNTSTLILKLYAERTKGSQQAYSNSWFDLTGRDRGYVTYDWSASSLELYLGESTITVNHNTDGTGSVALYGYWNTRRTGSSYIPTEISVSQTITLPTIPRTSQLSLSASSVILDNNITVTTNRASSNFVHNLYYQIDGGSWVTFATGVGASYTWKVPLTIANSIPNGTQKTINVICETYNGSASLANYIGSSVQPLTVNVPSNLAPSITNFAISGGENGIYVQDLTNVNVSLSASGSYSSTITTYKIELVKGTTVLKTAYGTSITFALNNLDITSDTDFTIRGTVTDSRGRSTTSLQVINVKYYYKPKITSYNAYRSDASGNRSDSGTYIDITWGYSIRNITNVTTSTTRVRYRQVGTSTWTNVTVPNAGNVITGGGNISVDYQYEVEFYASDGNNSVTKSVIIQTGYSTVDYKAGGKGIAFGKASEKDEFECNMVTDFKKDISWNLKSLNNANLNNYKKSGTYFFGTGCSNVPSNNCNVIILGNEDVQQIVQIAITTSTERMYVRTHTSEGWGSWKEILHEKSKTADTDFNSCNLPGFYFSTVTPTGDNLPVNTKGLLETFNNGTQVLQRYTTFDGNDIFQRNFENNWGTWRRVGGINRIAEGYLSARQTITGTAWNFAKISLDSIAGRYGAFLSLSNGGIKIGKYVHSIKISGRICWYQYNDKVECNLQILRNSTNVAMSYATNIDSTYLQNNYISPILIDVNENDIIYIGLNKGSNGAVTVLNEKFATNLTVEIVQ